MNRILKCTRGAFDVVYLDEAAQTVIEATLHLPLFLRPRGMLFMTGDPRQLPASSISVGNADPLSVLEKRGMSYFLDTQRRMPNALGTLTSTIFYNGRVHNVENATEDTKGSFAWVVLSDTKESCLIDSSVEKPYPSFASAMLCARLVQLFEELGLKF